MAWSLKDPWILLAFVSIFLFCLLVCVICSSRDGPYEQHPPADFDLEQCSPPLK